jgi:hypothetical protein
MPPSQPLPSKPVEVDAPVYAGPYAVKAIDAFLLAASLHLGGENPEGKTLKNPEPMEAWLAILGARALLRDLGTYMSDALKVPLDARLLNLGNEFARLHPAMQVPVPELLAPLERHEETHS